MWPPRGLLLLALPIATNADLYMHSPRGSNNKLNEVSNNVRTNTRLFDSENNDAGGYQVGDDCKPVCSNSNNNYDSDAQGAGKGQMQYYEGSRLHIEWTNQHGCGASQSNVKCNLVLQYMCNEPRGNPDLRDGKTTDRIPDNEQQAKDPKYGMHETYAYYQECKIRERNKGLYIADRNLNNNRNKAINTRQNENGNRNGFECPEERDYYPYWHPTPWRDIAVFTDDVALCPMYDQASQNRRGKGKCCNRTRYEEDGACNQLYPTPNQLQQDGNAAGPNNRQACISDNENDGIWVDDGGMDRWGVSRPDCIMSPFARDNHLGNSVPKVDENAGLWSTNRAPSYEWTIPGDVLNQNGVSEATCVLRMRYNISTTDYDSWGLSGEMVDAKFNGADAKVKQDNGGGKDVVGVNAPAALGTNYLLNLNINTSQYGRTFEDRSHTFKIKRRDDVPSACKNKRIYNLNYRGRRGNIVQTYPSVEYDFVPNQLELWEDECIHFQWTGSDANPAGNAGNGRRMTDRTNLVELSSLGKNVPVRHGYEQGETLAYYSMFPDEATVKRFMYLSQEQNCSSGVCVPTGACDDDSNNNQAIDNCKDLNAAPGYFDGGVIQMGDMIRHPLGRTFYYMSTRNNDFTNRSQKASITVKAWKWALIIGSIVFAICAGVVWSCLIRRRLVRNPEHRLRTRCFGRSLVCIGRHWDRIYHKTWLYKAPWTVGLVTMCIVLFAIGYWRALGKDPAPSYAYAKACGQVLDFTCNLIFLPVLRNFMSWLRATPLRQLLPLNSGEEIYFHKVLFVLISLPGIGHVICHFLRYEWYAHFGTGDPIAEQLFFSWSGLSGVLILLCMTLMAITALERVRRGKFKGFRVGRFQIGAYSGHSLFVRVHKLWVVVLILLLSHSKAFWHYAAFPVLLVVVDKLIGYLRGRAPVRLVEAVSPARDIIALKLQLSNGRKLRYQAGQYIFLHCPQVSTKEWHPFTLSSSPEERYFGVHIRCRKDMDWTYSLKRLLLPDATVLKADIKPYIPPPPTPPAGERDVAQEGGFLSWFGFDGGKTAEDEPLQGDAAPTQSSAVKLQRSIRNLFAPRSNSFKDGLAERSEHPTSGMRFLRRHKTKSIPSATRMPPPPSSKGNRVDPAPSPPVSPPCSPPVASAVPSSTVVEIGGRAVELFVDGPYGSASEDVFAYSAMILVGAGIGVTPFASILRTLSIQMKQGRLETPLKKVQFYWVCRDEKEFEMFKELLVGVVDDHILAEVFSLYTYITGEIDLKKVNAKDKYHQFAGKPDWRRIGKEMRQKFPDHDVGVFLCGPNAIGEQLKSMCDSLNPKKEPGRRYAPGELGPRFVFHKETF